MTPSTPPADGRVLQLPPDRRGQPQPLQRLSFEYEQGLLGAILVRPEVFGSVIDAGVKPESFRGAHALIFGAMFDLHQKGAPIDLVTVSGRLRELGLLDKAGGPVFLAGLSEETGFAANAGYYAHRVLKEAWRRDYKRVILEINGAEQMPGITDDDLITFLSSKLVELEDSYPDSFAQQNPLISLDELLDMKFPENGDIISGGIWPAATGVIIGGESGDGKSLLINQLSICLAMGWDFLGLKVPAVRRVAIFQAENTLKSERYRFRRMIMGMGISQMPPHIALYPMQERLDLDSPKDRKKIVEAINDHGAEVFFLDPLISFHNVPENDNTQMRRVLDSITEISRKTGAGCGLTHHFSKPGPNDNGGVEHRFRGARAIKDWADTMVALTTKKAAGGKLFKQITFAKVRNGRKPSPILVERDEYFICQLAEEESRCSPEQVAAIIRAAGGKLSGQKELVAAIQDVIECGERSARKFIQSAIEKRMIQVVPGERDPGKAGPAPKVYVPCEMGEGDAG